MNEPNYYEILNVPRNATQEQIKSQYRNLALKFHPDKNRSGSAIMQMSKINLAYEILSDQKLRDIYDREGIAGVYERYDEEDVFQGGWEDYEEENYDSYVDEMYGERRREGEESRRRRAAQKEAYRRARAEYRRRRTERKQEQSQRIKQEFIEGFELGNKITFWVILAFITLVGVALLSSSAGEGKSVGGNVLFLLLIGVTWYVTVKYRNKKLVIRFMQICLAILFAVLLIVAYGAKKSRKL